MKTCSKCGRDKPLDAFPLDRRVAPPRARAACKECERGRHRQWRSRNAEHLRERTRAWRLANPDKVRETDMRAGVKYRHSLEVSQLREMLERQGGHCAICGTDSPGGNGRFHVDHDHGCCPGDRSCGKCVRGLLCARCNFGLGYFRDNAEYLRAAADYIGASQPRAVT